MNRTTVINHTYYEIPFEESSIPNNIKESNMHIGSYTAYKTLDFLISRNYYYSSLRRQNKSIIFNRQFTKNILIDLKKDENARFRKHFKIDEDDFILFLGIGNR